MTGGSSPSVAITVTSFGGDAGRVQPVTDPRGIVAKTDYDYLGRTVRTVAAFSAFAPSSNLDNTTEYTYDGMDHVVTLQADSPSGTYQQTKWIYGVTTAGGNGLQSTELDFTTLSLAPGRWVKVGDGDNAGHSLASAADNGFCRI